MSNTDCTNQVQKMFEYQINVLRGDIVQIYYIIPQCVEETSFIANCDSIVTSLLDKNFESYQISANGVYQKTKFKRRDLDIQLQTYQLGDRLKSILKGNDLLKIHKKLMLFGEKYQQQDMEQILRSQNDAIQNMCNK